MRAEGVGGVGGTGGRGWRGGGGEGRRVGGESKEEGREADLLMCMAMEFEAY